MGIVAIDSKAFIRKGKRGLFRANTGVAIKYRDTDFIVTYLQTMKDLCQKYGLNYATKILKSYDILKGIGPYQGSKFLDEFATSVSKHFDKLEVFTTVFDTKAVPKIKIYGTGKTAVKEITPVDFIKSTESAYVHLCAWSYIDRNKQDQDTPIMLDHFEGEVTNAWNIIKSLPNVHVYLRGDKCNPYIATSDILVKLLDIRLHAKKSTLNKENVIDVLSDLSNVESVFIGPFNMITPVTTDKIDLSDKLAHPIIFILREGIKEEIVGPVKEHTIIENSPLMNKLDDFAFEQGGCVKFFDANKDQNSIQTGDIFVPIGDSGYSVAEYYRKLGYNIGIIKAETLTKK